jgi:hypothetical protein
LALRLNNQFGLWRRSVEMVMRNKAGQLAVVVPWAEAADDIKAHGGKVVTPTEHTPCGLGPPAWQTEPTLLDGYGNALAWDDRDLKPLGKPPTVARKKAACAA